MEINLPSGLFIIGGNIGAPFLYTVRGKDSKKKCGK